MLIFRIIAFFLVLLSSAVANDFSFNVDKFSELPLSGVSQDNIRYGYQWYSALGGIDYRGFSRSKDSGLTKLNQVLGYKPVSLLPRANFFALWTGNCNGVANLALVGDLPDHEVEVLSDSNQLVVLEPSDLHAIISLAMNQKAVESRIFGQRCNRSRLRGRKEENGCAGMPAHEFHLLLANFLGLKKEAFVIDTERYLKVNNLPVLSYRSGILSQKKVHDRKIIEIQTMITVPKVVSPFSGSLYSQVEEEIEYVYYLEVDSASSKIISGHWISKERPDFAWRRNCSRFEGVFSFLNGLIEWKC